MLLVESIKKGFKGYEFDIIILDCLTKTFPSDLRIR